MSGVAVAAKLRCTSRRPTPHGSNLVERFFALLTEEALRRGSHTSIPQLRTAIYDYVEVHNDEGKPFAWTKSADEILDKVREFGERTLKVHGDT